MPSSFIPTRNDVERYRRLRVLSMDLNSRIIKTIPRRTFGEVGEALGILRNGVLVFETEDMTSVHMDCCLYEWFTNGKNIVQRYAETHPPKPGTDEAYLLDAYLQAKYRVLLVQSAMPGASVYCRDVLNGGELFLMDLGLSRTAQDADFAFATRTIPLGEYSMSSGAGLPVSPKKSALDALCSFARGEPSSPDKVDSVPLRIVRACFAAGAASHIAYETVGQRKKEPHRRPRGRWL